MLRAVRKLYLEIEVWSAPRTMWRGIPPEVARCAYCNCLAPSKTCWEPGPVKGGMVLYTHRPLPGARRIRRVERA